MPERDGTGLNGIGPTTGHGSGNCTIPLNTAEEEFDLPRNQEKTLREQLQHIETRVRVLEAVASRGER
jgi:hypothetical protein